MMARRQPFCCALLFFFLNVFVIVFAASCKSPYVAPANKFVRTSDKPISDVTEVAVIVDSCVTMDALKDYICVDTSRQIESYMTSAIKEYLENVGYHITSENTPFVGGFKNPEMAFLVKQTKKEKVNNIKPPFYTDKKVLTDKEYQQCLGRVTKEAYEDVLQQNDSPSKLFKANLSLQNDLQRLREHLNTRYLLIVTSNSTFVPGLTSFSQAMVTGMATGLLTGGLLVITTCDVSYIDTYIALIDLEQNELFWSNSLRLTGDIRKKEYYSTWNKKTHTYDGWVQNLFFHIPVKSDKLIEAAKNGDNNGLEWMTLTGTDLNATDAARMTALHWSTKNNRPETVKFLIKKGASIDCQDSEGNTPLHYAVENNQYNLAKIFLEKKPDITIKNKQGLCPLDIAVTKKNDKLAKLVQKHQNQKNKS